MSSAYIPLLSLYTYTDGLIFNDVTVPEGIDKETLIDAILLRCGHFECVYSNADFLHAAIKLWFRKWKPTFEKWVKALSIKYDPLNNYDRYEEYEDVHEGKQAGRYSSSAETGTVNTQTVSAYDSDAYEPDQKNNIDTDTADSGSSENTENKTIKHKAHLYGNIGVTTSQQMLEAELEIDKWNIYEKIADMFTVDFTLPIY